MFNYRLVSQTIEIPEQRRGPRYPVYRVLSLAKGWMTVIFRKTYLRCFKSRTRGKITLSSIPKQNRALRPRKHIRATAKSKASDFCYTCWNTAWRYQWCSNCDHPMLRAL